MTWHYRRKQAQKGQWVAFAIAGLGVSLAVTRVSITDVLLLFVAGIVGAALVGFVSEVRDRPLVPGIIGLTVGLAALTAWTLQPVHEPLKMIAVAGWAVFAGALGGVTGLASGDGSTETYVAGLVLGCLGSFVPIL